MKLDCKITEIIRSDFGALWSCKHHGDTVEISTPFPLPGSKFARVFITTRGERFIVTEDGDVEDLLKELSPSIEISESLPALARECKLSMGSHDGQNIYFKECTDPKFISSLVFDVASFCVKASNILLAGVDDELCEEETERDRRFQGEATDFIKTMLGSHQTLLRNKGIDGMPDVRFSAIIQSASKLWIVSYVTGSTLTLFRRSTSDTALSFKEARSSRVRGQIQATIPLLNNFADGYRPDKLAARFQELEKEAHQRYVSWTNKELMREQLAA